MSSKVARIGEKARTTVMGELNVVQITDCHLGSQPNERLLGLNTDQSLHDVLSAIQRDEKADLIVTTGDISNDGGPISYARFLKIIDDYFPETPLAWLPGNHDDPANMIAVGCHPVERNYHASGWNFIFLDSRIPGEEGGRLGADELARLERELSNQPKVPAAIFLHHQPLPVGSAWVDQYVVDDAEDLFAITDAHPQVKLISWGHIHQEFSARRNDVALIATPSTCVQFLPKSDEFKVDKTMPGYRTYRFCEDGTFNTRVSRIAEKTYSIDMAATGY